MSPTNPFTSNPRGPEQFLGRDQTVGLLWSMIYGTGESVLVVSELPNGRTSLLRHLEHGLRRAGRRTYFIDVSAVAVQCTAAELWSRIREETGLARHDSAPTPAGAPILLLDDFHCLLDRPLLLGPDFLGELRTLSQARVLPYIGASTRDRLTLTASLRSHTLGSDYLSNLRDYELSALDCRGVEQVLAAAGSQFSGRDCAFVARCAGGEPRLVNILAWHLFELNRDPESRGSLEHHRVALMKSKPEFRKPLHELWKALSCAERCYLLRVVAEVQAGAVMRVAPHEPSEESGATRARRFGALVRLFQLFPRSELRSAIRTCFGPRLVMNLASDHATDAAWFTDAAEHLERIYGVTILLAHLRSLPYAPRVELDEVFALYSDGVTPSVSAMDIALDRLVERGLVQPTRGRTPWEIRPALLHWWLLDHLRDPVTFFNTMDCDCDNRELQGFIGQHRERFVAGALPAISEALCL